MTGRGVGSFLGMPPVRDPKPVLDDDGLLRFRGRWVAVPDAQLAVVELLVERYGCTVPDAELTAAYTGSSPNASRRTFTGAMHRLARRVRGCGLELRRIRTRGYLLDAVEKETGQQRAEKLSHLPRDSYTSPTPS